jgi:hypothetical protein
VGNNPESINFVGDFPGKGVELHYHFAKLQLNSLALRGASPSTVQHLSQNRKDHANIAISSAISVLSIILEEPSIHQSLVGVPLYINTMVAFAAVFLLKVTAKWKSVSFNISTNQVWSLVERVIDLLNSKCRVASGFHIIPHVALGLEKMLHKCVEFANSNSPVDDSRLWDATGQHGSMMPEPQQHHANNEVTPYAVGHGQQQQQQQQHWQPYQQPQQQPQSQQPPPPPPQQQQQTQQQHLSSGTAHGQLTGVLYSQAPESIHNGQPGQVYEVNGQYFGMGVFDFLSPQLPY